MKLAEEVNAELKAEALAQQQMSPSSPSRHGFAKTETISPRREFSDSPTRAKTSVRVVELSPQ